MSAPRRPHFGERLADALAARGPLCLGIDPLGAVLHAWGLPDSAEGARELGLRAVEAASGVVGAVKPQVAFFERHGAAGYAALEEVIAAARAAGLLVIADAKRGDIGSTIAGYAAAWLRPGSPLEADALTVVAYQGTGSLEPAFALAAEAGKGLFVLAATSNPEARAVQSARLADDAGQTVASLIAAEVDARAAAVVAESGSGGGVGPFGVVIGATIDPVDFALDLDAPSRIAPILAPGFGEQGASPEQLVPRYGAASHRVVANVARGALLAGPEGLRPAVTGLAARFRRALRGDS